MHSLGPYAVSSRKRSEGSEQRLRTRQSPPRTNKNGNNSKNTAWTQSLGKNVLVSSEDRHQKHLSLCCDATSSSSTAVLRSMFDPHEKLTLQTKRGKPAKTSIKRPHLHGWHFEHTQNTPETCSRRHAILLWILLLRCGRNPSQVKRRRKRFRWRHKLNTISLK